MLGPHALARFPSNPNPFQAARLHPALAACARRQATFRPSWQHEIKWDGYRLIARKDGEQVRLWTRTTSDYSKAFTRDPPGMLLPRWL
jgi:bifunctional non-homologous end joining protein LigD